MGGNERDLLVLHPLLKSHHILRHIPDLLDGAAALDVEGVQNVLRFGADRFLIGDVVRDRPHLLPVELLGVQEHTVIQVCLIDVEIHHTGIGTSDLSQVRVAETSADLRSLAPVLDLRLNGRISAFHHTGDDRMALSGSFQVSHTFADSAAGIQFAQPGRRIGIGIVRRFLLLDIHQHDRHIQVPDCRKHVVGCGVGQQLHDHQVHVRRAELVPCRHGLLLGGHQTAVDDVHGIRQRLFECLILGFKFRYQRRELGQIRAQRDGKNANSCSRLN